MNEISSYTVNQPQDIYTAPGDTIVWTITYVDDSSNGTVHEAGTYVLSRCSSPPIITKQKKSKPSKIASFYEWE
jgi:hypothetical protein